MKSRKLARRYAIALGELAEEKGLLKDVEEEMKSFRAVLIEGPSFQRALESENVSSEEKLKLIDETFRDRFSKLTLNFLLLVVTKHRETVLKEMVDEFLDYADEKRGVVEVEVTTATPLTDEQSSAISGKLAQMTGKEIRLTAKEDADLLGGIVARIGDLVMDGSVKSRLNRLGQQLKKAQLN